MGVVTVTGCAARRRELGRCLRAYRDLVDPSRVGLHATGRRRAPGLRREEVAVLAGVGVTWYTWLEQGRVTASDQVLEAVARVYGIDDVGREHLRALCRPADDGPGAGPDGLRPLLDGWPADPAAVLDARLDVVAVNDAWARVWGPPGRHVLEDLVDDGPDDDVELLVRALARRLRMATDRAPQDPRLHEVHTRVRNVAPHLHPVWECRGIGAFGRPAARVGGADRVAYLLGEAGVPDPTGATVLALLPG